MSLHFLNDSRSGQHYPLSLITLFVEISASHRYADHRHEIKYFNSQDVEKIVLRSQNQTVTDDAVEINLCLREVVISNKYCADFDSAFCLILRRFGYWVC